MSLLQSLSDGSLLSDESLLQAREGYRPMPQASGADAELESWTRRMTTQHELGIAREMGAVYPELEIDMDVIVAGGLLHDVGKAWEFDPINRKRWKASQKRFGRPSIRHPAYGAHICLTVGLPEEIAHIAMAHSGEGELLVRSLECMIAHQADYTFWNTLLAGGQLKPETVPPDRRRYVIDRPF